MGEHRRSQGRSTCQTVHQRIFERLCCTHHCHLAAINSFTDVIDCDVQIHIFHQNTVSLEGSVVFCFGQRVQFHITPKTPHLDQTGVNLPISSPDVIVNEFERLIDGEAFRGIFSVVDKFNDEFRDLVWYYRLFVYKNPGCDMEPTWIDQMNKRWLRGASQRHPTDYWNRSSDQFVTIQLLSLVDAEAAGQFENRLEGMS